MAISRWDPTHELLPVREAMSRLFDESFWFPHQMTNGRASQVPMDVYTEGDDYFIEVALPGVKPEDVNIEMMGNSLTIAGEAHADVPEGRTYLVRQRRIGKFETSLTLPVVADASKAEAHFEHGVLRLRVPKSEAAKPKRITLQTS